jgi:autotransporter translocation and assembly factor TamB
MDKDRDLNASINLENYSGAVSSTVIACGDSKVTAYGQCESAKQETDLDLGCPRLSKFCRAEDVISFPSEINL